MTENGRRAGEPVTEVQFMGLGGHEAAEGIRITFPAYYSDWNIAQIWDAVRRVQGAMGLRPVPPKPQRG